MASFSNPALQSDMGKEQGTVVRETRLASTVSSKSILSNFSRTFSDQTSSEAADKRRKLHHNNALDKSQRAILRRLQDWTAEKSRPPSLARLLYPKKVQPPARKELVSLVEHYFPPRAETLVQVFDFGDEHATRTEIRLGDIKQGMRRAIILNEMAKSQQRCKRSLLGRP